MTNIDTAFYISKFSEIFSHLKLSVADFGEAHGYYICNCYIPDIPSELNEKYAIRTVTVAEITAKYADKRGSIWLTSGECIPKPVTVDMWLHSFNTENSMKICLAHIINDREHRSTTWDAKHVELYNLYQQEKQLYSVINS